jgi:AcrR family transcriptional regulator
MHISRAVIGFMLPRRYHVCPHDVNTIFFLSNLQIFPSLLEERRGPARRHAGREQKTDRVDFFLMPGYPRRVMSSSRSRRSGPTKGERTRQRIVEQAAKLFNVRGTAGASMADITEASGLEKGGVYNHFESKDSLVLEAFDYAAGLVRARRDAAAATGTTPLAKLRAMIDVQAEAARKPLLPGGCPLLNTAIESDDTNPALRSRVRREFDAWQDAFAAALRDAVAAGDLRPVDAAAFASAAVAALEGGIMLSSLYRDQRHTAAVIAHLNAWLDGLASA